MATSPGKVLELPELRIRPGARIAPLVESLYCPNLRTGASFAVADSYQELNDVTEASVVALLMDSARC